MQLTQPKNVYREDKREGANLFQIVEKEQLKVPAHIDYLGDLRDFVVQVGKKYRYSHKIVNAFKLAIDEAATNIIRHAYRDKDGHITIRGIVKKKSLTIVLIDQGTYFDPNRVKEPDLKRYIDIGKKGGLGIFIMRKLMDDIDYRKTEEGNELRITKYLEAPEKKKIVGAVSSIPLSLKVKYFFRTIAILTIIIAVGYIYFYFKADDEIVSNLIAFGQTSCNQIANRLGSELTEDLTFFEEVLRPIYEEKKDQLYRLSIENTKGIIDYSSNSQELFAPFTRPGEFKQFDTGAYEYRLEDGINVYEFENTIIIKKTAAIYGKVHVFLLTESTAEQISAIRINDLKLALFILFLSYIGVAMLIYLVMNPFRKLSEWVRALGHGEIDDEMDIDGSTEIGEIAQAFSDITQKFRESQKNLVEQERLQKELQVAQEIQQTLLPMEFPELEGYELASYYEAAKEVGGDYYDFVEVDKDTLGIAVADVSGKGVPGSLVMTMIRTALRTEARGIKDAAEVLARVNDFVIADMKKGMFVTVFYLIIDSKKRCLNYASAGHNPMILYRGSTKNTYYLNPKGFPIGIQLPQTDLFKNYIQSDTIQLAEDDILLVYTDGITEAMNSTRELFGEERLLKALRECGHLPVEPFVEKLKESIYSFTEGKPQYDDITLVAIKENSSREKDELRRAKEAHRMIAEGKRIREACEIVNITTYAYYNKYKRIFVEEGTDAFEIDEEISVEAKHLSIEEKTKIFDIIANHPEYGAGRISHELNTENYGYTQISEGKIYEELVRSRLNTRQLRQAYVAKSKMDRRRLKPPGTPLLTLDGRIIMDRQMEVSESHDERIQPRIIRQKIEEEPTELASNEPEKDIESKQTTFETPHSEEKAESPSINNILDSEIEADSLIDAAIEELLAKDDVEANEGEESDADMTTKSRVDGKETKGLDGASDLINEFLPENNLNNSIKDMDVDRSVPLTDQENNSDVSREDEISFEELFEGGNILEDNENYPSSNKLSTNDEIDKLSIEPSEEERSEPSDQNLESERAENSEDREDEINLDFLNDDEGYKQTSSFDEETIHEDLTISSSLEELLAEDQSIDTNIDSSSTSDELKKDSEVVSEDSDSDEEAVSFADLIQTIDDEIVYISHALDNRNEGIQSLEEEVQQKDESRSTLNKVSKKQKHELSEKEKSLMDGIKYYKNKDYDNAIKEFKKVIEIYPDFKEAHTILGNAYFRNNMLTEAETTYEKVKQMDPEDITAYENMGVIYANKRDYKNAIQEWKKVLDLNPERTDIENKIAKALRKI